MDAAPALIALEQLDDTLPDIRIIAPTPEADAALVKTVRQFGVMQPILVRPSGNRFEIVAGRRRVRAARDVGLTEIAALVRQLTDAEAIQAQVIENKQRELLHPIDIWRATTTMLAAGVSLKDASLALGLDERQAKRNERLAQLHPDLLALAEREMPEAGELKAIAAAPPERQAEALKVRHAIVGDTVNWHLIAHACRQVSIAQGLAIFDVARSGVVFEEDWFAEPGSPEQFITHDIAGFLKAQRAALEERVAAATKRGERLRIAEFGRTGLVLPKGWIPRYDMGSRPLKKPDGPVRFAAISEREWELGKMVEQVADPPRTPGYVAAAAAAPLRTQRAARSPQAAEPAQEPAEDLQRPPITKMGQEMIAAAKTEALAQRIRSHVPELPGLTIVALLVLAFAADNVKVHSGRFTLDGFSDIPPRLVDAAGRISLDDAEVRELAADVLARTLLVTNPVTLHGSGDAAEWIGDFLRASAALPRFDTAEFLAQLSSDELRKIARSAEISVPKKVGELRTALTGHAPAFRPTTFGAPGPKPKAQHRAHRVEEEPVA